MVRVVSIDTWTCLHVDNYWIAWDGGLWGFVIPSFTFIYTWKFPKLNVRNTGMPYFETIRWLNSLSSWSMCPIHLPVMSAVPLNGSPTDGTRPAGRANTRNSQELLTPTPEGPILSSPSLSPFKSMSQMASRGTRTPNWLKREILQSTLGSHAVRV